MAKKRTLAQTTTRPPVDAESARKTVTAHLMATTGRGRIAIERRLRAIADVDLTPIAEAAADPKRKSKVAAMVDAAANPGG